MSKKSQLRGAVFEWFVRKILENCGFKTIPNDPPIIYTTGTGKMIHGLGQPHNADLLMAPPFQTPFYFPSRILVECKCYDYAVGLPEVRNVLGLRTDINNFDVVTPEILRKRSNYRRRGGAIYNFDRYLYQVALASISGFKLTAEEFAATHRIPLISFADSTMYLRLREFIREINDNFCNNINKDCFDKLLKYFKYEDSQYYLESNLYIKENIENLKTLSSNFYVGVLESGDFIFLYNCGRVFIPNKLRYKSVISWTRENGSWRLSNYEYIDQTPFEFLFELPGSIYDYWSERSFDKYVALDIKTQNFRRISVYGKYNDNLIFFILDLSLESIKEARDSYLR